MGAESFSNDGFDLDQARYERQNRLNEPVYNIGDSEDGSFDDFFGNDFGTSSVSNPFGSTTVGSSFGESDPFGSNQNQGGFGGDPSGGFGGHPQQQQQKKDMETMFYETASKAGKGSWNMMKDIGQSIKTIDANYLVSYGRKTMIASGVLLVIGLLSWLFQLNYGFSLVVGSVLAEVVGNCCLWLNIEKVIEYPDVPNNIEQQGLDPNQPQIEEPQYIEEEPQYIEESTYIEEKPQYIEEEEEEDEDFMSMYNTYQPEVEVVKTQSPEEVLSSLAEISNGMYTRQFLYESFERVLPNLKPDYAKVTHYTEEDGVFLAWDKIIVDAAEITGLKPEDAPELLKLEENLFTIKATITRPTKLKPDALGVELAKAYAYKTYTSDSERSRVFAKTETILKECIITIFTGQSHLVSLKDMYTKESDFVTNSKKQLPVVLGVDEKGAVRSVDFKSVESIIIAGMPRSGKSWLVQAILTQMCALVSPKDLNLYFIDPKAGTSDFKQFRVPHVKGFASQYSDDQGNIINNDYPSVIETLRYIVNVEAPRRKKIIGDAGEVNINDFRESNPDVELPLIYLVFDEMVTLSKMNKEDYAEYKNYLDMIVTQFPNLGIKGMFIPHAVKDSIISKTAYDSIKARISVKGSPEHIESSTGTKPRDFKYQLANVGDMAVSIDSMSNDTMFIHGVALTSSNGENNKLFNYIQKLWLKYEPDSIKGSILEGNNPIKRVEEQNQEEQHQELQQEYTQQTQNYNYTEEKKEESSVYGAFDDLGF